VVFLDGPRECSRQHFDLGAQQLGEPQQHRRVDPAAGQLFHDLVDRDSFVEASSGRDDEMPIVPNPEVAVSPTVEPVQFGGVIHREPVGHRQVHPSPLQFRRGAESHSVVESRIIGPIGTRAIECKCFAARG